MDTSRRGSGPLLQFEVPGFWEWTYLPCGEPPLPSNRELDPLPALTKTKKKQGSELSAGDSDFGRHEY